METFDYSRLRRNSASVICKGQGKAFVVGHSLRPTASVQCEGDTAVSCGRKAATRASFPPCWGYYAHQCRQSRHRRAHSCCRSWTNARKDIHRQAAESLALMGRAVSVSQSLPGLRSCQSLPHGCCLMSGFAAIVPTRPANSVLGGSATSSAYW